MPTKWRDIHFILNEDGNVIGDFKEGREPYGFLRDRKVFSFEDATKEERELLVNLVYLFYTVGDTQFHEGYEYVELEGYMMYRKVEGATYYKDFFYKSDSLPDNEFLFLSAHDDYDEYYILTTQDKGVASAIHHHFMTDYGIDVSIATVYAESPHMLDYWRRSSTVLF